MTRRPALGLCLVACLVGSLVQAKTPVADFQASVEIILDESETMTTVDAGRTWFQRMAEASLKSVEGRPAASTNGDLTWRVMGGGDPKDDNACDATRQIAGAGITPAPVLAVMSKDAPRGPRPLSAALEAAAVDLPRDRRQRGLVIVTSGGDTCGRDPCTVAADLRSTVGLGSIRVFLLGDDAAAADRLACLGSVTRIPALAELKARLADAVDAIDHPAEVSVSVTEDGQNIPARVELFAGDDPSPALAGRAGDSFQVLAGPYQIHVLRPLEPDEAPTTPHEGWRRGVEIVAGSQLAIRVPIGVEASRIVAQVQINGVPAPLGTRVSIFRVGETSEPIGIGIPGQPIRIGAGRYDVRAEIPGGPLDGIQVWKPEVRVNAGQTVTVSLVAIQKRGTLLVNVFAGPEPLNEAQVMLLPPGSRAESQALFSPGIEIPVAAGTYTVVARLDTPGGRLETAKDNVVVAPDRPTNLRLDIGAPGRLTVQIAGRKAEDGVPVGLVRPGGTEPIGLIESFAEYVVPPGKYDLRVEEGARVYWQRNVKVPAGEKTVLTITPP